MFEYRCDVCKSVLNVRESDIGKRVRCPNCGMIAEYRGETANRTSAIDASSSEFRDPGSNQATGISDDRFRIDEDSDRWSLKAPDGVVYGPVSRMELDEWEREGRVSAKFLVQRAGQVHWQSALVLYPHLAMARPAPQNASQRPAGRELIGEGSRGERRPGRRTLRSNNGIGILIVAVIGMFLIPGVVFGLIAWIMGRSERRAMDRGECSRSNEILVHIGYYLGILATLCGLAIWLGCCVLIGRL
jgi:DNA-directed RNA polymerase subunit M/transcription elongation factor TFIIS